MAGKNYTRLLNPTLHVPFCSKLGDVQCFVCFYYSQGSSLIEAGVEVWSSDPMGEWGHLEGCFFLTFFQYCMNQRYRLRLVLKMETRLMQQAPVVCQDDSTSLITS